MRSLRKRRAQSSSVLADPTYTFMYPAQIQESRLSSNCQMRSSNSCPKVSWEGKRGASPWPTSFPWHSLPPWHQMSFGFSLLMGEEGWREGDEEGTNPLYLRAQDQSEKLKCLFPPQWTFWQVNKCSPVGNNKEKSELKELANLKSNAILCDSTLFCYQ